MAFNGSGVYSLAAGNPVVTGTTISSTWANNTLNDIATGLTTTLCKDGQSTPTANIKMGGYKITGLAAATLNGDAVRFEQIPTATSLGVDAAIQKQTYVAFTTAGTATAFTLTPSPAIVANTANTEFEVTFNQASGATPTLAVSGLTALPLKYRSATGALTAITSQQVPSGWTSKVYTDATNWIVAQTADAQIAALSVTAAGLASDAVTTAKILAANVTAAKLDGAQSGSAPIYGCRAWCRFDGTTAGTNAPTAGGNVATIQRVSTGSYKGTFTTAMADSNYSIVVTFGQATNPMLVTLGSLNAGDFSFETKQPGVANYDQAVVCVHVFR